MAPSPTIRRLLKETAELSSQSSNPNPAFYAAPVSEADLHEWHFTLLGPPSPSPYAGGMYHGRITLPATYPLKPPNFRFLTPSGRFEVNREICLSISGFHEETWMPAWGVRTALTALRSFMAEKGSAGQVGGLEASADVRKRLARESRGWKCEACGGGKTNEGVMKEWWEVCRQAGVNVQEEEGVELETLPEGLSLEAREANKSTATATATAVATEQQQRSGSGKEGEKEEKGKQKDTMTLQPQPQPQQQTEEVPPTQPEPASTVTSAPSSEPLRAETPYSVQTPPLQQRSQPDSQLQSQSPSRNKQTQSQPQPQPQPSSSLSPPRPPPSQPQSSSTIPLISTPSAEATQASAEAVLTPSDFPLPPPSSRPPGGRMSMMSGMSGIHAPPLAAANAALANPSGHQPLLLQRDREREYITIDRAIAGVFLALCLMVLKKIFYPAAGLTGGGGGVDDFYLQRE
ncbi:hypothetical protein LTR72_004200 [Exophiala xenobiotica]|nr:hypothetical protein LTR72_004200 [Exophiala xenobiotica]KAK5288925.1 hypothetical protein LTR14_007755 [Exophiala xenobiotica]KAK5380416.1 hypothetical protein LTS13_003273 [Exophiala xenobiotica]KAK5393084.1 hypothetical protein LTR79_009397 [Exophiala xenobiotica]KAK5412146.1 hypothetical protein LTR90_007709 [Exophiala xenobiotica]